MLLNDGFDSAGLPEHVFENVLGRVQPSVLQKLKAIESARLQDYRHARHEFKIGGISKTEFSEVAERGGRAMMNEMLEILQHTEVNATDYCVKHKKQCSISPRDVKELAGDYWVECSGNTCCPWSSMSDHSGWLDAATLPFLVWAISSRYYEPDTLLQENVPGFQHEDNLISDINPGVLKAVSTRHLTGELQHATYPAL